ncbi:MAG TPA: 5'-3' exonuclease H3TH domain-containing protein [Acidimicrobiales bacterium]|jgi:5'-3' exonuclease
MGGVRVHLVDGTYELFRHHFALPSHKTGDGREVAATRGTVGSVLGLLEQGATHVGVATDHVIESFRNDLWPGYKTGEGVAPELSAQFPLLEQVLEEAGVAVWAMVELEADDALASAADHLGGDDRVDQVLICTPDKDLAQCVQGDRVVQLDRRRNVVLDEGAVMAKYGVAPESIPDYLALVGDSADGFPGLAGWGARSAAAVLARWRHLERIPRSASEWDVDIRNCHRLAATLAANFELALRFRRLATLERDADLGATVEHLRWQGPRPGFEELCATIDAPGLAARAKALATRRAKAAS